MSDAKQPQTMGECDVTNAATSAECLSCGRLRPTTADDLRTRLAAAEAERDEALAAWTGWQERYCAVVREREEARDQRDASFEDVESLNGCLERATERAEAAEAERDEARAAADRAAFAARTTGADLLRIGALCGMTDDEYPLKAVERVVAEAVRLRALLRDAEPCLYGTPTSAEGLAMLDSVRARIAALLGGE